ncbi:MAG: glycosyltransferase [Porticoccus sp.]|nr:glycosyltransferase [Porticoccus sp.]
MKITVVTVHLNDFSGLSRTLKSLELSGQMNHLEWIVIDGGSQLTDRGLCFKQVKSIADYFISEPDKGIYDAMNKGTSLATGDYVLYLNAGDELHPDFDVEHAKKSAAGILPNMILGRCEVRYQDGSQIKVKTRSPSWAWYCMPAYHPAILFRRDILGDNPYDTTYKLAADYDLVCRLLVNDARVTQLASVISVYHRGGVSDIQGDAAREEENQIRLKYFQIPVFVGNGIKRFKKMNAKQSPFSKLTRLLRRWV